jgi:hypothetical protein
VQSLKCAIWQAISGKLARSGGSLFVRAEELATHLAWREFGRLCELGKKCSANMPHITPARGVKQYKLYRCDLVSGQRNDWSDLQTNLNEEPLVRKTNI